MIVVYGVRDEVSQSDLTFTSGTDHEEEFRHGDIRSQAEESVIGVYPSDIAEKEKKN